LSLVEALLFVGIDWAAKAHAVCVLDPTGRKVASFTIAHTTAGFAQLLGRLGELRSDPEAVRIAVERPDGRPVDALLNAGQIAIEAMVSPDANDGSQRCFWSSVVSSNRYGATMSVLMPNAEA
jgi:glutaminase